MSIMQSRRSFIKACLAAGVVSTVPGWAFDAVAALGQRTQTRLLLGTFVSITIAHKDAGFADEAMEQAFAEIERLERLFNRHDSSGALGVLNAQGSLAGAPPELCDLVSDALILGKWMGGSFDITVAPLVDLFEKEALDRHSVSFRKDFFEARCLVGWDAVEVRERDIYLGRKGMRLTLDGIAKGEIVDRASAVLSKAGASNFLINAGGDIYASGLKSDGTEWMVAVESPAKDRAYPAVVPLSNCAMATSGIYEKSRAKDGGLNHLVCTRSGISQNKYASVTVLGPNTKIADAMATTLATLDDHPLVAHYVMRRTNCIAFTIDMNGKRGIVYSPA